MPAHAQDGARSLCVLAGGRFSGNRLSVVISAYLREQGIDATAHQLRHWFATEVYASSKDIRVTQELLGHSDPSTTAGYVAYSHVDAAAAVASLSLAKGRRVCTYQIAPPWICLQAEA